MAEDIRRAKLRTTTMSLRSREALQVLHGTEHPVRFVLTTSPCTVVVDADIPLISIRRMFHGRKSILYPSHTQPSGERLPCHK